MIVEGSQNIVHRGNDLNQALRVLLAHSKTGAYVEDMKNGSVAASIPANTYVERQGKQVGQYVQELADKIRLKVPGKIKADLYGEVRLSNPRRGPIESTVSDTIRTGKSMGRYLDSQLGRFVNPAIDRVQPTLTQGDSRAYVIEMESRKYLAWVVDGSGERREREFEGTRAKEAAKAWARLVLFEVAKAGVRSNPKESFSPGDYVRENSSASFVQFVVKSVDAGGGDAVAVGCTGSARRGTGRCSKGHGIPS